MPTNSQDKNFAEEMEGSLDTIKMSSSTLDNAIEWIASNLEPGDVFPDKELQSWAENNGFVKE